MKEVEGGDWRHVDTEREREREREGEGEGECVWRSR